MNSPGFMGMLRKVSLMGILRDVKPRHLRPLFRACDEAGLRFLEVTMNTENASDIIRALVAIRDAGTSAMRIGAGTVRTVDQVREASAAGAEFIVSPGLYPDVMGEASRLQLPTFPGALTPTEVSMAWAAGAFVVKVFPVKAMGGPSYIRELRGPFRDIPLMACGGVNAGNVTEYLAAGVDVLAFGGSIFNLELMEQGSFDKIGASVSEMVSAVRKFRGE